MRLKSARDYLAAATVVEGGALSEQPNSQSIKPPPATKDTIFGAIRFSVISKKMRFQWLAARNVSLEEATAALFTDARMESRFRLFEAITLPFLRHAAERNEDFRLGILTSSAMPEKWRMRLRALIADLPRVQILKVKLNEHPLEIFSRYVGKRMVADQETLCSFRIDDDDALNIYYFDDLRARNRLENVGKIITHENGLFIGYDSERGLVFKDTKFTAIALGLAYVSTAAEAKTIHDLGSHTKLKAGHPFEVIETPRSWIRTVHLAMDTASVDGKVPGMKHWRPLSEIADEFAQLFPFIDLEQMATALRLSEREVGTTPASAAS